MTKKIFHKQLNLFNFLKIKKLRKKLNEKGLLDEKGEVTKFRGVAIGQKIPGCPK